MIYTPTQTVVVADLTEAEALAMAAKFWSIMNGGTVIDTVTGQVSASVKAHPKYVEAGADSHFLFSFSDAPVEVAGAYSLKAEMDVDLSPADGTLVNCWDPDPAKRGRYAKSGAADAGAWVLDDPEPQDKCWPDYNHPQRLLELVICTYCSPPVVGGVPDNLPFHGPSGWVGPEDGDWRGGRIVFDMEIEQLRMGQKAKLGFHVQGNEPVQAAALTALYGEGEKFFFPNFINTVDLLSDQLGFGYDSWGLDNKVPVVRNSNRIEVTANFSADDDDWHCLGDVGRDPAGRQLNYGEGAVGDVLKYLRGNMYMIVHHPTPKEGEGYFTKSSAEVISEFNRVKGNVKLYGWTIEMPA